MADNKKRPQISEEIHTEISIRALRMKVSRQGLLSLAAILPEAELKQIVEKYLAKRPKK